MILIEVGIFLVLLEVSDQELASVTRLSRSKPLGSHWTLPTEALLEESTIRGLSWAMHCRVKDEVDRRG